MNAMQKCGMALALSATLSFVAAFCTYAENALVAQAEKTECGPQEQITVTVGELDENQQPVTSDAKIIVKLSRGGVTENGILKNGLVLKNGAGKFTFIAPTKPGTVDILLIDPAGNLSTKLVIRVVESTSGADWKEEYAAIVKLKGKVAIKLKNKQAWDAALVNAKLHEKDTIMTWDKSWVTLQLFDGSIITLAPCTTVYIKSLKSSLSNARIKQSVFKVAAGRILAKVKEYMEKGSKFQVESESATAGVRGTFFEFLSFLDGTDELIVYEGSVVIEQIRRELSYLLRQGQKLALRWDSVETPDIEGHNITPAEREQSLGQEEASADETPDENDGGEENGADQTEPSTGNGTPVDTAPPGDSSGGTDVLFGSEEVGDQMYLTVHFMPEFKKVFGTGVSIGLDLSFIQDPVTQDITFASPDPGVNIGNFINWVEFDGRFLYLYYGNLENISYDFGLLFNKYHKDDAKCMQFGLRNLFSGKWGFKVLAPLDIKSFDPFETEKTSSLYAGRFTTGFEAAGLPLEAGITAVTDENDALNMLPYGVPTAGAAADLSIQWASMMQPYIEAAQLENFGYGVEAGIRGRFSSLLWYQTGLRYCGEQFIPNYFGGDYEEYKYNSISGILTARGLPDLSAYPQTRGYYFLVGAEFSSLMNFSLMYEDFSNMPDYAPILTADFIFATPSFGPLPALAFGFNYKQVQFGSHDGWLNPNTSFAWYATYPISAGLYATLVNTYVPATGQYTREIAISLQF
ncbi:MAG: FecR domain-containing protein [Bacillota bacterium]